MANPKVSIFSEALGNITQDFRNLKAQAPKKPVPTIGEEQVSPKEFRARLERMAPEQRRQLLQKPGMRDQILNMIKEQ